MKAWFFSNDERTVQQGDETLPIIVGGEHSIGESSLEFKKGLYGYKYISHALINNAEGHILWQVELGDTCMIDRDPERIDAKRRIYIAGGVDMSKGLEKFTRWCAIRAVRVLKALPPSNVFSYLKTGNEDKREEVAAILYDMRSEEDDIYAVAMSETHAIMCLESCVQDAGAVYNAKNASWHCVKALEALAFQDALDAGYNRTHAMFLGHRFANKERTLHERFLKKMFKNNCNPQAKGEQS